MGFEKYKYELEEFLDTDKARSIGNTYVRQVLWLREDLDFSAEDAAQMAIKSLDEFDLVGILEDLPRFSKDFSERFSTRLRIRHANRDLGQTHGGQYARILLQVVDVR